MPSVIADIELRDRPRERLDRFGPSLLTNAELVALVIRSGTGGESALHVAQELLADRGLCGLATADIATLGRFRGMGTAKSCALAAAFELGRRAQLEEATERPQVRGAADLAVVAAREIGDPKREEVVVVVMDRRLRILRVERLTVGTDGRCFVDPRDVLRAVLAAGGSTFALVHNHPGGDTAPSAEDVTVTRDLQAAARTVGLRFLEHVIVAGARWSCVAAADSGGDGSLSGRGDLSHPLATV